MGLLRSIFRIRTRQVNVVAPGTRPIYPPEDTLTLGYEEFFVTLALLVLSYIVLSTPWFKTRLTQTSSGTHRTDTGVGWREAARKIRHVRSIDDLRRWWRRLRRLHWVDGDLQQYLKTGNLNNEQTVRIKHGRGIPSPRRTTTPLRSLFSRNNNTMRSYSSENHLPKSLANVGHSVVEQKRLTSGGEERGDSFFEENVRAKTDHDRFEEAYQSHIRFAEYRRLVLPPECRLVELTSQWREIEQTLLENFLNESTWNKILSRVREIIGAISRIGHCIELLWSGETIHKFSTWMLELYHYRLRKQRGMSVEDDDESDDDDDGGVTNVANHQTTNFKSPEATPMISNRTVINETEGADDNIPIHPLSSAVHLVGGKSHERENDSSLMNISQSAVRPRLNTIESNDDTIFASISEDLVEKNNPVTSSSFDVPSFVEKSLKTMSLSPLPMERNKKPKMKHPGISPIEIPELTPTSGANLSLKKLPLEPSHSADSTLNFFDTANSDRQLRDMSRAVPIPDARGYILGDEFIGSSCTPLLVFVNSRSGSRNGHLLITQFRRLLNPIQVWDLAHGGPEKVLKSFSLLSRFQLLICGGDGTVSWIISALEKLELKRWPPMAILPLGTGNDLSRIHGWGGGYNNESLLLILRQISESYMSMLDLWELDITSTIKKGKQRKEVKDVKSFTNYLGVGVDAQAALQVHNLRESSPMLFFSRFFNKAWYAIAGGEEAIKSSCANLPQQISLVADGIEIDLPPDSQGIIFLNIDSYAGGIPMWSNGLKPQKKIIRSFSEGDSVHAYGGELRRNDSFEYFAEVETPRALATCDSPSSCQDGLLDVVSVRGTFHLGQIRVGLSNAQLLCQCREASVTLKKKIAVQTDGEPWRQTPSTLKIVRKPERATMLNKSDKDSGGVETEITKLLHWANEKEVIDRRQYAILMEEFSRRSEFKKRARGR